MLLFTLAALSVIPEPVAPALTPVPSAPVAVNWLLEILKITLPSLLAIGGALYGAYRGFELANRGRKHDILYKERYRGFEEVAGYLYSVIHTFDNIVDISEEVSSILGLEPSQNFVNDIKTGLARLSNVVIPNRRYLVLLSENTRKLYFEAELQIEDLTRVLIDIATNEEGIIRDSTVHYKYRDDLKAAIGKASIKCEAAIKSAIEDVDLPSK